jgi:DNA-binding FadR family transcriptional regulator
MATDPSAVQLANEITDLIRRSGLKSGVLIASEQDLRARHDVGRSVLRQAVRILGERGVASMKRGAGGGLIVAPPDPQSASRALAILLESRMQGPHALDRLLSATDTHVFLTATPRLDLVECERVRRLALRMRRQAEAGLRRLGEIRQLLTVIRRLVKDPLAGLAYQTTAEFGQDLAPYSVVVGDHDFQRLWWDALLEMIEAQMAGDIAALFDLRRRQLAIVQDSQDAWSAMDRDSRLVPQIEPGEPAETASGQSPADRLARELLRDVRLLGWAPGARIGGAGDLLARYGVTVGTLRQAVRMLEQNSVVRMERGRSGGLVVTLPDPERAIDRALEYLRQTKIAPDDLASFRCQLMLSALSAICQLPDAARAKVLEDVAPTALFGRLGVLSGDGALEVFHSIVSAISPVSETPDDWPVALIFDALAKGDAARARRIFLNHEHARV